MKRYLLFTIVVLQAMHVMAQHELVGRVVDGVSRQPLPFASVYVDKDRCTITNAEGGFSVDATDGDTLRITYVGYKPLRLSAAQARGTVRMEPLDTSLQEVVVYSPDAIIQKLLKAVKHDSKVGRRSQSNMFYRQTTRTDGRINGLLEAFLTANDGLSAHDLSLVTGRYASVGGTNYFYPVNFFTFAEVEFYNSMGIFRSNEEVVPLSPRYQKYYIAEYKTISQGDSAIYVIHFQPRVSEAISRSLKKKGVLWNTFDSYLYVRASDLQVLKYEGKGVNMFVQHQRPGKWRQVLPVEYHFTVHYQDVHHYTQVQSVNFTTSYEADGVTYETAGLMFNVADRYVKGKKKLYFDDNIWNKIKEMGYDKSFWQKNEVVKRTSWEEETVELFDRDNLFGVFE